MQIVGGYHKLKGRFNIFVYSSKQKTEKRNEKLRETRDQGKPLLVIASNCLVTSGSRRLNALFPTGKDKHQSWDWVIIDEAHSKAKSKDTQVRIIYCRLPFDNR